MSQELIEKLKVQIIETLNLEDLEPSDIDANDPLFGDDGIGLDSIDALELIVLMNKEYNIQIADPEEGKNVFYSIQTMASYIQANSLFPS
ncbi:MAG: acyl carrier protein [Flavobacteriales bacterium]|nr:acyl carrier protein [Flavobacteriales bacterium]